MREHNEAVNRIDFIDLAAEIKAAPMPGEVVELPQHDGTMLRLRKLHADYDPTDRVVAMSSPCDAGRGRGGTGLLYVDPEATDLHAALNTSATPLNQLDESAAVPGLGRAGEDQRFIALMPALRRPRLPPARHNCA